LRAEGVELGDTVGGKLLELVEPLPRNHGDEPPSPGARGAIR